MNRILLITIRSFIVIIGVLFVIALSTLKIIDDQPIVNHRSVGDTYKNLEELEIAITPGKGQLKAGWAAVNITPDQPIDMAGYGPRGPYESVLDSLFARVVVFDNEDSKAIIISIDLLLFPPLLKERIEKELGSLDFAKNNIFLTATHTHHGFGNWEKSIVGEFAFGKYDNVNIDRMMSKIHAAVQVAETSLDEVKIAFQLIDAHELVSNRLARESGTKDPYLRLVHLMKKNGDHGMFISFSGHATNLDADVWELSGDYPGVLIDRLEENEDLDFVLFAAGMVGSHNIDIDIPKGHDRIIKTGEKLAEKIMANSENIPYDTISMVGGADIEIGLPASQLRLVGKIGVRDWVFRTFFGPLQANIKLLQIGEVLFIGMPCDYSGELSINNHLDAYANARGKELFITSFNGNYVGYITEDSHYYSCDHDEVKTLNWVGPYMGTYFTEAIKKMIDATE